MTAPDTATTKRSPRKFPYFSLKTAMDVAERVYLRGGGRVTRTQAAELLEVKVTSSLLEMRLITAAQFGLVKRSDGRVEVTDIGRKIVRPASEAERAAALVEAFESVPMFKAIKERFQGSPMPDEAGLKNVLVRDFDVPERQKNDAYNLLMSAGREAGILVAKPSGLWFSALPAAKPGEADSQEKTGDDVQRKPAEAPSQVGRTAGQDHLHPSIAGLIGDLPQTGADWSRDDREAWQAALAAILDVVYPSSRSQRQTPPSDGV